MMAGEVGVAVTTVLCDLAALAFPLVLKDTVGGVITMLEVVSLDAVLLLPVASCAAPAAI